MQASRKIGLSLGFVCVTVFTGCATVVSGRHEEVAIRSNPPQAHVAVHNDEGVMVASGLTPMNATLPRSKGFLRKPPRYQAVLQKPGFIPTKVAITPKINPWIFGNLIVGGPLGLVADLTTGALWRFSPKAIDKQLQPFKGQYYSHKPPAAQVTQATFVSDRTKRSRNMSRR